MILHGLYLQIPSRLNQSLLGTGANDVILATEGVSVERFLKAQRFLWTLSCLKMAPGTGAALRRQPSRMAGRKDGKNLGPW